MQGNAGVRDVEMRVYRRVEAEYRVKNGIMINGCRRFLGVFLYFPALDGGVLGRSSLGHGDGG